MDEGRTHTFSLYAVHALLSPISSIIKSLRRAREYADLRDLCSKEQTIWVFSTMLFPIRQLLLLSYILHLVYTKDDVHGIIIFIPFFHIVFAQGAFHSVLWTFWGCEDESCSCQLIISLFAITSRKYWEWNDRDIHSEGSLDVSYSWYVATSMFHGLSSNMCSPSRSYT